MNLTCDYQLGAPGLGSCGDDGGAAAVGDVGPGVAVRIT